MAWAGDRGWELSRASASCFEGAIIVPRAYLRAYLDECQPHATYTASDSAGGSYKPSILSAADIRLELVNARRDDFVFTTPDLQFRLQSLIGETL